MEKACDLYGIFPEKIEVFEHKQDGSSGDETDNKPGLLFPLFPGILNEYAGTIVDNDGEKQNEDILRDKGHVKNTAHDQQQEPAVCIGKNEVERRDNGKEYEKLK
jgi:hypothetical protein